MTARFFLLLITVCCPAAFAQALVTCPWLSTGTAATALGGDVTVTAHSENNWQGECHFKPQAAGAMQEIDIHVSKVESHPCPEGSARVKALGNEAVQCSRSTLHDAHADTIAGRVRDAWFEITMTNIPAATSEPSGITHPADPYGASLLLRLAEQVAGNLY
jgi:hypothetical protein